ncbi:MAG TPA: YfiR family protein [Gallionellaceae bacterium]|nr:YfiR family protein [Gallionellaceae bacterium]
MDFRNLYHTSLLLPMLAAGAAVADPMPEYQLKSAFIYNFATFIDWPDKIGKSLALCVAAPQAAMKYFSSLEGKPVGNMTVTVRHLDEGASAEGCQILFVTETESDGFDDWLSEVGDSQVLTVAESETWLKKGVMTDLLLKENRIVFDVNVAAAREVGMDINSKLLRLARKVYGLESADKNAK